MRQKLDYKTKSDFIKNETNMIIYEDKFNKDLLITRSMLSMKRKTDETEDDDGKKIPCRFLTSHGCGIHPDKPGVCWMYPFHAWREANDQWWRVQPHAKFVFTGDCPGFYLNKSLDPMIPTLQEYSKKIAAHLTSYHSSERRGYISTTKIIKNYYPANPSSTIVRRKQM